MIRPTSRALRFAASATLALTAALLSPAAAQDLPTSLPLTSVGDELLWTVGDQTLILTVTRAGRVTLDLFSPTFDPDAYRAADWYGDERYDARPITTSFVLTDAEGREVRRADSTSGASAWTSFLDADLPAGTYHLDARTRGNGKNTFAARLSGNAALSTHSLAVTVRAADWVPALYVQHDGARPLTLRMYDGDTATELDAALRAPDGTVTPFPVSAQREWTDVTLPATAPQGTYAVLLRQPRTARQHSNTVGFALRRDGQPAGLDLARASALGALSVVSQLVLPTGPAGSTPARVTVDGQTLSVPTSEARPLPAGTYALQWAPQRGADVTLPSEVTVTRDVTSTVLVQVKPRAALTLTADRAAVREGDVVTFTATASTEFAASLSGELHLDLPDGLEALTTLSRDVTFLDGRPATLQVTARATRAGSFAARATLAPWSLTATTPITVQGVPAAAVQTTPQPPTPTPTPDPIRWTRVSTIRVNFTAHVRADALIVRHALPSGATYRSGSATLDGQALPDPDVRADGTLEWALPDRDTGELKYDVTHDAGLPTLPGPALLARTDRGLVTLQDASRFPNEAAKSPRVNAGTLREPLDGTVLRDRDRTAVIYRGPVGADLRLNGVALDPALIARRTTDPETGEETVEYLGVRLPAGPSVITAGSDTVRVHVAGNAQKVQIEGVDLTADGVTPIRMRIRALDAYGVTSNDAFLTLSASLDPLTPDANPQETGYQVRLTDGEGLLELTPQILPTDVTVDTLLRGEAHRQTFTLRPSGTRLGVGQASVTAFLTPPAVTDVSAEGYFEGPLGDGKLFAVASTRGLPTLVNPNDGQPIYGDASTGSVPLRGSDPFAFRYEHPRFSLSYAETPTGVDVVTAGGAPTALTLATRGDTRVNAFAAWIPTDTRTETLTPDGTRLLRLPDAPVTSGSAIVTLVTLERGTGKELQRDLLTRLVDYSLDDTTGLITFSRPVNPVDNNLDDVRVVVTYRAVNGTPGRALTWGAQVTHVTGPLEGAVAAVEQGGVLTGGARVTYRDETRTAHARVATAGGGVQATLDASVRTDDSTTTAQARYQDDAYGGLQPITVGFSVRATHTRTLTETLGVNVSSEYHRTPQASGTSSSAGVTFAAAPFTLGAGVRLGTGDTPGFGVITSAAYRARPWDVSVAHTQPLAGGDATSDLTVRVALNDTTSVSVRDSVNWTTGSKLSVGLDTLLGRTNVRAAYELPGAGGDGNRARFGVSTTLDVAPSTAVDVGGAAVHDFTRGTNDLNVSVGVRYRQDALSATAASDFALRAGVLKSVLHGGLTGQVDERTTLSADGTAAFGVDSGARASVSGAYRGEPFAALGYLRYQHGSFAAGAASVTGAVNGEYHLARFAVRGGLAARVLLDDPDSFTVQPYVGATLYLSDTFGVGVTGSAQWQPATNIGAIGLGVEGSARVFGKTWMTLGYNFSGFESVASAATRPGVYLRLDVVLDERTLDKK